MRSWPLRGRGLGSRQSTPRPARRTPRARQGPFRTGCPWRDAPRQVGPWQTPGKRHDTWSAEGTWDRILAAGQGRADGAGELDWAVSAGSSIVLPACPWGQRPRRSRRQHLVAERQAVERAGTFERVVVAAEGDAGDAVGIDVGTAAAGLEHGVAGDVVAMAGRERERLDVGVQAKRAGDPLGERPVGPGGGGEVNLVEVAGGEVVAQLRVEPRQRPSIGDAREPPGDGDVGDRARGQPPQFHAERRAGRIVVLADDALERVTEPWLGAEPGEHLDPRAVGAVGEVQRARHAVRVVVATVPRLGVVWRVRERVGVAADPVALHSRLDDLGKRRGHWIANR
ncbi:MAG: transposase [Actinomycetota bacterium]